MASTEIEYKDGQPERRGMGNRMQSFKKSIYDGENKTFIGRTGSSWAKIGVFYLIYYSCLAAFFAASLFIFFTTVDDKQPSQTGDNSLIKSNPGLAFRPMPNIESTLIKFNQGDETTYKKYTSNIESFLEKYKATHDNQVPCSPGQKPPAGKVCQFNVTDATGGFCTPEKDYGYYEGRPCVLLKMNKVYGWEPTVFENGTVPADIENHDMDPNGIYVTCTGENPSDRDNLGEVEIYPKAGFLKNFFPYDNTPGYQSPVVFVRMNHLKTGVAIQVWCKAWAGNIIHNKNDKAGSTHFEILMD